MIIMEFEEMKKVWDNQNNEPMFIINMKAMHQTIRKKRNRAQFTSNISEWMLIAIAFITFGFVLIKQHGRINLVDNLSAIILLLTSIYVFFGRIIRKKREKQFDKTILGDLDQAISNVDFEINRAKTFIWWYLLPVALPAFFNMYIKDASLARWIFVISAFIFSYVLVNWGLKKSQLPAKRKLIVLREKILEEITH